MALIIYLIINKTQEEFEKICLKNGCGRFFLKKRRLMLYWDSGAEIDLIIIDKGSLRMAREKKNENMWPKLFRITEELQILHEKRTEIDTPLHTTFAQLRILSYIRYSPTESVKIKEIADELHITPAAASQIVERMVQLGVVERTLVPGDRRSVSVTLSPEGRECWERSDSIFESMMKRLLRHVPEEKLSAFQEVLNILLTSIGEERLRVEKQAGRSG